MAVALRGRAAAFKASGPSVGDTGLPSGSPEGAQCFWMPEGKLLLLVREAPSDVEVNIVCVSRSHKVSYSTF